MQVHHERPPPLAGSHQFGKFSGRWLEGGHHLRKARIPTCPISSASPTKCKSIMNAHHHLLAVISSANFPGDGSKACTIFDTPDASASSSWPETISGCR